MEDRSIGDERTRAAPLLAFVPERAGTSIGGRYRIEDLVGRGGMGAVYKCRDEQLGRQVAVKRLLASGVPTAAGIARFQHEARAVASLNHRNIVIVHEFGEDDGGPFLVMEFLEGMELDTLVRERGALQPDRVTEVAGQVCAALSYAHRRGVIHRDVKPSNLVELADGTVKVLDFGLARVGTESQLSREGFGLGTLDYVSPEQRRDATRVDHRSDLFSLGATLYFLATGRNPRTVRERDVPEVLREVVLRLMEEREEDRFFSADEVVQALRRPTPPAPAAAEEGQCPDCRTRNPEDARYCVGCGTGLFEECPACDAESRAGQSFCHRCGANIPEHRKADEHAARATEFEAARQWSRARKEWKTACEHRPDWDAALDGRERVDATLRRIETLQSRARDESRQRDVAALGETLRELTALCPADGQAVSVVRSRIEKLSARAGTEAPVFPPEFFGTEPTPPEEVSRSPAPVRERAPDPPAPPPTPPPPVAVQDEAEPFGKPSFVPAGARPSVLPAAIAMGAVWAGAALVATLWPVFDAEPVALAIVASVLLGVGTTMALAMTGAPFTYCARIGAALTLGPVLLASIGALDDYSDESGIAGLIALPLPYALLVPKPPGSNVVLSVLLSYVVFALCVGVVAATGGLMEASEFNTLLSDVLPDSYEWHTVSQGVLTAVPACLVGGGFFGGWSARRAHRWSTATGD